MGLGVLAMTVMLVCLKRSQSSSPGVHVMVSGADENPELNGFYRRRAVGDGRTQAWDGSGITEENWNEEVVQDGSEWWYEKDDGGFIYYRPGGRTWYSALLEDHSRPFFRYVVHSEDKTRPPEAGWKGFCRPRGFWASASNFRVELVGDH